MEDHQPWFAEETGFFGPNYLLEYAEILPHEKTLAEINFLEQALSLQQGMTILDMPCGHGRHSIELAKRGYAVTGVDLNNFFLKKAQETAKIEGVDIRLLQGDMRKVTFENEFDVVLNLFTAIGYFDNDDDDQNVFALISRSLKTGGQFVVDFINRDWLLRNYEEKDWRELSDGSLLLYERTYNPLRGQNTERRIHMTPAGVKKYDVNMNLRLYTPAEFIKMAAHVGLSLKANYGDWKDAAITISSKRTILIFAKA